jgi:hypothetical protein
MRSVETHERRDRAKHEQCDNAEKKNRRNGNSLFFTACAGHGGHGVDRGCPANHRTARNEIGHGAAHAKQRCGDVRHEKCAGNRDDGDPQNQ